MDCIEAMALKPSLRTMKTMSVSNNNHQMLFDDVYYSTLDDFVNIDDLLDLSNGDFTHQENEQEEEEKEEARGVENDERSRDSVKFNGYDEFEDVPAGEFSVPIDDLENLEWVSRVVHDSGPGLTLTVSNGSEKIENGSGSKQKLSVRHLCFPSNVPAKPRTKRSRPVGRIWSLESPSLSESSSSSTHSGPSSPTSCLMFYNLGKPVKKRKKTPVLTLGDQTGSLQILRCCSHCQVQKTPQWRSGPLGAKTLCNACGVRFKSGRLYPEYRPASSPTFSGPIHSNSHRKVLEMRRVKETTEPELKP